MPPQRKWTTNKCAGGAMSRVWQRMAAAYGWRRFAIPKRHIPKPQSRRNSDSRELRRTGPEEADQGDARRGTRERDKCQGQTRLRPETPSETSAGLRPATDGLQQGRGRRKPTGASRFSKRPAAAACKETRVQPRRLVRPQGWVFDGTSGTRDAWSAGRWDIALRQVDDRRHR
jgi:hypothetical protein